MVDNGEERKLLHNLAVDCVIFGFHKTDINLLLIRRTDHVITDKWALPGALIYEDEGLEEAAARILFDMSGVRDIYLDQVKAFGSLDRSPGRIISIAYYALVDVQKYKLKPKKSANIKQAKWFKVTELPELPYDHKEIAFTALMELKRRFRYEPLGYELLPEKFTFLQLQQLYEAIYEVKLDKGNFRRKMQGIGHLVELDESVENKQNRKAKLFKFDFNFYQELLERGIYIDIAPKNGK